MISESLVELHRIQREAVALCRNCTEQGSIALERADGPSDILTECTRMMVALCVARDVGQRCGFFSPAFDLTYPATKAIERLFDEAMRELRAGEERG